MAESRNTRMHAIASACFTVAVSKHRGILFRRRSDKYYFLNLGTLLDLSDLAVVFCDYLKILSSCTMPFCTLHCVLYVRTCEFGNVVILP